ncbi:MAG: hypothetical protein ABI700_20850 [Chloroflexota bacterium]
MNKRPSWQRREADRVYRHIAAFVGDNGYPPTCEDIAEWLGLERLRVEKALKRLRADRRICEGSTLPTENVTN